MPSQPLTLSFRTDSGLRDRLRAVAYVRGCSMSQVIQMLLAEACDRYLQEHPHAAAALEARRGD